MSAHRRTVAEIDLDALDANVRSARGRFPAGTFFCPMVKADAYGHGAPDVARALEESGVKHLGVCLVEEAIELRAAGVQAEILVFIPFGRAAAAEVVRHRLTPVVGTWDELAVLEEAAAAPLNVHLKFDTGMNRVGFAAEDAARLRARFESSPKLKPAGLCTHLLRGEDAGRSSGESARQLRAFSKIADHFAAFGPVLHALNSAGLLSKAGTEPSGDNPLFEKNWGLRPGLMIYGADPLGGGAPFALKPVMTLKSAASTFRQVKTGESVSYNATWRAGRDSLIAVVPIGYADGYHRILSNQASALFDGKRVPVVGTVCMDYLMLDVTDAVRGAPPADGGEVVLFGRSRSGAELPAAELAAAAKTIPWEIMTSVSRRVPRVTRRNA